MIDIEKYLIQSVMPFIIIKNDNGIETIEIKEINKQEDKPNYWSTECQILVSNIKS